MDIDQITIDDKIEKAKKLIINAQNRYEANPLKARYGLELAERILDEALLCKRMTRYSKNNPYQDLYQQIYLSWEKLNNKFL